MALSNPRATFGIHSIAPYNTSTGAFYGIAKVIGTAEFALAGELVELNGGSSKFPWSVQEGLISSDLNLTLREYPNWLFEVLLGQAVTDNAAESGASVTTITDKFGSSVVDATTGIASVSVTTAADVKYAAYVVVAASATTVDVYASTDLDFARGTDLTYQTDLLKITASPLTITTGGVVAIPNTGLSLTGGSGAIAFTTGHTATFKSRPINTDSIDVTIGSAGQVSPEFGCFIYPEKLGNGEMFEIEAFRCKGIGLPFPFSEKAFGEAALSIKAFQDVSRNGVFTVRTVVPSTFV